MHKLIRTAIRATLVIIAARVVSGEAVNTNKYNLLATSDWMKIPSNVVFAVEKTQVLPSIIKVSEKEVEETLNCNKTNTEQLGLEAPGKSDLKYGKNVKALKERIMNLFKKEEVNDVETEEKEILEEEKSIEELLGEEKLSKAVSYIDVLSEVEGEAAEELSKVKAIIEEKKASEYVTELKKKASEEAADVKRSQSNNSASNASGAKKAGEAVENVEEPVVAVEAEDSDKRCIAWNEVLEDGTPVIKLVTKKEYERLIKEYTCKSKEERVVISFIYRCILSIRKLIESSIVFVIAHGLYKYISNELIKYKLAYTELTKLSIPVVGLCLPVLASVGLLVKGHKREKGIVMSILAVLSVYQIKYVDTTGSIMNKLVLNWPTFLATGSILFTFAMEYAYRSMHNEAFPVQRRKTTARIATTTVLVCTVLLSLLSHVMPYNKSTRNAITSVFLIIDPRIITHIIQACIIAMSFAVSVMILNMRSAGTIGKTSRSRLLVRIGQMITAILLAVALLLTSTMSLPAITPTLAGLGLVFNGFSILFGVGLKALPADSILRKHGRIVSTLLLIVSVKILLSLAIYIAIVHFGYEGEFLMAVSNFNKYLSRISGAIKKSYLGAVFSYIMVQKDKLVTIVCSAAKSVSAMVKANCSKATNYLRA
ncbi:hypothetical protein NEPAR04_1095 [Nematocida parisii]|nr:hypothetical protein NEPAR08_0961 [Nematocida parisii]KAI5127866.1 hypothetical protein NEPAR03_1146 [Nematocida parisii]KAI5141618.1 hypothetical protein NEPAR04_1095 [Nematocida parisii]